MYSVGEKIVYGVKGVFEVTNIDVPNVDWLDVTKEYYTLLPLFSGEKIYTPIDTTVFMRPIMSKDEAEKFILTIPDIAYSANRYKNPRTQEMFYQTTLGSHDLNDLVRLIKGIREKCDKAVLMGKKPALVDERYLKRAETLLYEELAASLEIEFECVYDYIRSTIGENLKNEA